VKHGSEIPHVSVFALVVVPRFLVMIFVNRKEVNETRGLVWHDHYVFGFDVAMDDLGFFKFGQTDDHIAQHLNDLLHCRRIALCLTLMQPRFECVGATGHYYLLGRELSTIRSLVALRRCAIAVLFADVAHLLSPQVVLPFRVDRS